MFDTLISAFPASGCPTFSEVTPWGVASVEIKHKILCISSNHMTQWETNNKDKIFSQHDRIYFYQLC